jgi:hypothetical protein
VSFETERIVPVDWIISLLVIKEVSFSELLLVNLLGECPHETIMSTIRIITDFIILINRVNK